MRSTCMFLVQPSALPVKTEVYALLPTHVLALLAGLDQLVMKVRLLVYIHCDSTYIALSIIHNGSREILLYFMPHTYYHFQLE